VTATRRWYAALPDASGGPELVGQPAGRLLVPRPADAQPRSVAGLYLDRVSGAGTAIQPRPEHARSLRKIAPHDDEARRGSLTFDAVVDGSAALPLPFPEQEREHSTPQMPPPMAASAEQAGVGLARRLTEALQVPLAVALAPTGPLLWPRPLLPFQLVGVRELIERESLLLADDMGLGKTVQAIAALRVLLHQRRIASALIVTPVGVLGQWRTELRRWAPELRVSTVHGVPSDRNWQWQAPAHLYLTSYETLRADFTENPHAPVARLWDVVVLDEAQKIKNPAAELSRVCKRLRRRRQWALTGTPLENGADDLTSILDFVDPAAGRELHHFLAAADLRDILRRVQLRRRRGDVLHDLPPKLVSEIVLPLTPNQRASYERAAREGIIELRQLGARVQIQNVLDLIVRLRQICNVCPETGESSKLGDLRERLAILAAEGHKALVFTQFANAANGARAIAARLGPSALAYTGDLTPAARDAILERFRRDPRLTALVLSMRAGGQGLNLQEASYVVHFDRWWNPAVEAQAEARSHRMGQRHPVNVYVYTCQDTIEERVEQILRDKRRLFAELVDDVSLDPAAPLNDADLYALIGLAAPRTGA